MPRLCRCSLRATGYLKTQNLKTSIVARSSAATSPSSNEVLGASDVPALWPLRTSRFTEFPRLTWLQDLHVYSDHFKFRGLQHFRMCRFAGRIVYAMSCSMVSPAHRRPQDADNEEVWPMKVRQQPHHHLTRSRVRPMHLFFGDSSEDGLQATHWSKSLAGLEACRGFQGLQVAHGPHGFSQRAPIDVLSTDLHHPPRAPR